MAKNVLTYEGLKQLEDELTDLKVNRRREIAQKIKEAREQGDLSENAEYDAAKDEQRDIETRIEEIENILKNAEVYLEEEGEEGTVSIGCTVKLMLSLASVLPYFFVTPITSSIGHPSFLFFSLLGYTFPQGEGQALFRSPV